jgi:predicted PurR-regulated permease PerM
MGDTRERLLFAKFAEVTRATVKGNLVVAIVQGALGGFIFWALGIPAALLWAVVMAFLSLLPAVGAAIIWAPVAAYLLAVGSYVDGIILIAFGAGVIGLVDNLLRPILVGRDTKLPDYLVLLSTLGGMALFGINGFVIGPLIAALFIAFWGIFMREINVEHPMDDSSPDTLNETLDTDSALIETPEQ